MRNQNLYRACTDSYFATWVFLDILSQSSIFREHDPLPLADLQALVGMGRLEEWDLFGVLFGVPICTPVSDGPGFYIHSDMLTEVGVRPPFTPFEKRIL